MLSEHTQKRIVDLVELRLLDAIRVKGKTEPVRVYELLGRKGEVEEWEVERARQYEQGFDLYTQRRWKEAVKVLQKIKKIDDTVEMLEKRCKLYSRRPPEEDWDGVFTRTQK